MRYVVCILQPAGPFYSNDAFKQVINCRWTPLALGISRSIHIEQEIGEPQFY